MMTRDHTTIKKLIRLLVIVSTLAGLAILGLASYSSHNLFSEHILSLAEYESKTISTIFQDRFKYTLFVRDQNLEIVLNEDKSEYLNLDREFRFFLDKYDLIKIKIFSLDGTIVYSTDHNIIGKNNSDNKRLAIALKGQVDSHEENKDSFRDLKGETALNIDVVETYIPIFYNKSIVGAMELYRDITMFNDAIHKATRKYLFVLASILLPVYLIAFAVAQIGTRRAADSEEALREIALHDPLTSALNRRGFMERSQEELARLERQRDDGIDYTTSLIMFDIDHFKKVNDTYGHPAGDSILIQLSGRIEAALRIYDVFGRYGGEEFVILLPNVSQTNAILVAERLRVQVEQKPFFFEEMEIPVTISLGVSVFSDGLAIDGMIENADQALYKAKKSGRNRVVAFETGNGPAEA